MADSQRKTANLFDGTMESGTINVYGVPSVSNTRIRSVSFTEVEAGTYTLTVSANRSLETFVFVYNLNDVFIERIPISWTSLPYTFTISTKSKIKFIFAFAPADSGTEITIDDVSQIMLNEGSTPLPYEPYGWVHSLRKLGTATDTITTLPADLYADGQPIGANLFDVSLLADDYTLNASTGLPYSFPKRVATLNPINVANLTSVTLSYISTVTNTMFIYALFNGSTLITRVAAMQSGDSIDVSNGNALYISFYSQPDNISSDKLSNIMMNEGSTALPYQPYAPTIIKGNMSQTGTPTPQNPIQPSETGERTGNLFDISLLEQGGWNATAGTIPTKLIPSDINYPIRTRYNQIVPLLASTLSLYCPSNIKINYVWIDANGISLGGSGWQKSGNTATAPEQAVSMTFILGLDGDIDCTPSDFYDISLVAGSIAPEYYEPYGYKLDIKSANTTTPVYLGEVQTTRNVYKYEFTGNESWSLHSSFANLFVLSGVTDYKKMTDNVSRCSHYKGTNSVLGAAEVTDKQAAFYYNPSSPTSSAFYIKDTTFSTAADFKTYLQQQYSAGTPVTVWYVLATPTTGIVNEPLRKIGDYADTVSGITIPTITGADSFDVLTTLKPSEVSLSYTGWHDATVKEWDGSDWQ